MLKERGIKLENTLVKEFKQQRFEFTPTQRGGLYIMTLKGIDHSGMLEFVVDKRIFVSQLRVRAESDHMKYIDESLLQTVVSFIETDPIFSQRIVMIYLTGTNRKEKERITDVLVSKGYEQTNTKKEWLHKIEKYEPNSHLSNHLIKKDDWKEVEQHLAFLESFEICLKSYEEKEKTFQVFKNIGSFYDFHLDGYNAKITVQKQMSGYKIFSFNQDKDKRTISKVVTNKEEIENYLDSLFSSIKQSMRIPNVLKAPRHFYNRWMSERFSYLEREEFYQSFLKVLTPQQIEEMSAFFVKTNYFGKRLDHGQNAFLYDDKVIIIMEDEIEVIVVEQKENWEQKVVEEILKIKREKLKRQVKDLS